ncbi:hypothetical protein [uncultured Desulfobacter sp.]|uniref:hypothetical protein n=1 Tax=uncultured Desulfobacter sp. TaxID=240139 RepID=UPI0029F57120|nr:hypothetical protein [uncultured Desulfobacter sp.]
MDGGPYILPAVEQLVIGTDQLDNLAAGGDEIPGMAIVALLLWSLRQTSYPSISAS